MYWSSHAILPKKQNLNSQNDYLGHWNCPRSVFCLTDLPIVIFSKVAKSNLLALSRSLWSRHLLLPVGKSSHSQTHDLCHLSLWPCLILDVVQAKSSTLTSTVASLPWSISSLPGWLSRSHFSGCLVTLQFVALPFEMTRFTTIVAGHSGSSS